MQNGATRCASELTLFKSGELHCWDRGYNDDGVQVSQPLQRSSWQLCSGNEGSWCTPCARTSASGMLAAY